MFRFSVSHAEQQVSFNKATCQVSRNSGLGQDLVPKRSRSGQRENTGSPRDHPHPGPQPVQAHYINTKQDVFPRSVLQIRVCSVPHIDAQWNNNSHAWHLTVRNEGLTNDMLGQSGHFHCAIGQVSLTGFPTSFEVWDKSFAMEEKIGQ